MVGRAVRCLGVPDRWLSGHQEMAVLPATRSVGSTADGRRSASCHEHGSSHYRDCVLTDALNANYRACQTLSGLGGRNSAYEKTLYFVGCRVSTQVKGDDGRCRLLARTRPSVGSFECRLVGEKRT